MPSKILENCTPIPWTGCFLWEGALDAHGYGTVYGGKRKTASGGRSSIPLKTHRVAYEQEVGPIPSGKHILHTCHVRSCCNPAHLYPGTDADNARDMCVAGRHVYTPSHTNQHKGKTHCLNGHEFDATNTYVRPTGGRHCRACHKERTARYYAKLKQKTS